MILNVHQSMHLAPVAHEFDFGPNADLQTQVLALRRKINKAYKGTKTGYVVMLNAFAWDLFTAHKSFKSQYASCCDAARLREQDLVNLKFLFMGVMFQLVEDEECYTNQTTGEETQVDMFAAPLQAGVNPVDPWVPVPRFAGVAIPLGTSENFEYVVAAPAAFGTVNKYPDRDVYSYADEKSCDNKRLCWEMETNQMPFSKQPNGNVWITYKPL
jgi:hypothetical protein